MKSRASQISVSLLFFLLTSAPLAHAQQPVVTVAQPGQQPQVAPAPTIRPDQKAYDDARRIKDPQKKIEALEKVITDFPESFYRSQARIEILDTLLKSFPNQKDRIHLAVERIIEPSQG